MVPSRFAFWGLTLSPSPAREPFGGVPRQRAANAPHPPPQDTSKLVGSQTLLPEQSHVRYWSETSNNPSQRLIVPWPEGMHRWDVLKVSLEQLRDKLSTAKMAT